MVWLIYGIYYAAAIGGTLALAFGFADAVVLDLTSLAPAFVILLMLWQAYIFYTGKGVDTKSDASRTAYTPESATQLTGEETGTFMRTLAHSYLIFTPACFPFLLFLNAWGKCLSVLPFFLAIVCGALVYRARNGKKIRERAKMEDEERAEQEKKEEHGEL